MPNQTVNKVEFGNQTIMDITDTSANANDVIEGEVFYNAAGARTVGSLGDATTSTHGLMSAADKSKLDGIAEGATANVGTITGITMNGDSKGTSGVVNLGTVLTAHQDISGKADKSEIPTKVSQLTNDSGFTSNVGTITGIKMNGASKGTSGVVDLGTVITAHQDISGKLNTSLKGVANGLAELDENGKVPSSQLPSYVDDVLEFAKRDNFPLSGEAGKIYVNLADNKTYRWGGSEYIEISASLALGTTSSTAFRGDYGNAAYTHASAKGSAYTSGLYKITTNSEGHVTNAVAVEKSDITALGIPSTNTTYTFDGTYNASTNKAATVSTVTNAINALDGGTIGEGSTGKTITSLSQTNGNVSATFSDISITKSQVSDLGTIGAAAAKGVDTSIAAASTSVNLPTSKAVAEFVEGKGYKTTDNDTKNTAGSINTSSKIFLIGATSQAANPQTYSHDTAYVGTDGCLYSGGAKVLTAHQDISGKKNTQTAVSDPTASGTATSFIKTISQNAQGVITPTKASLPTASTTVAGIVQLNNTLTSTSTSQALTAAQGKALNDHIGHVADGLGILANGNTHAAIANGQAVFVRNHGSLADGLYWAKSAISANGTLSTSNLTADASGGFNKVKTDIDTLNSNINSFQSVTFTPASGIKDNLFIRRYGRVVCANGYLTSSNAFTNNQLLGNVQAGHRPIAPTRFLCGVANQAYEVGDIAYMTIDENGDIYIAPKSGNTYKKCYFSASYVVQS